LKSKTLARLIGTVFVLIICEVFALLGLKIVQPHWQQDWRFQAISYEELVKEKTYMVNTLLAEDQNHRGYIRLDADLGWSVNSNGVALKPYDDPDPELYRANGQGIRSSHEYQREPANDVVRVAVFGDSFTHADDVQNDLAWTTIWEKSHSNIEVLNFGVPGYGTDQAYLRYQKHGKAFSPDIAVLGIMSENLNRNLNHFIPFYRHDAWPNSKPRFEFAPDGTFTLRENVFRSASDYQVLIDDLPATLTKLGEHDWWYNAKYKPGVMDKSALYRLMHYGYILFRYPWMLDSQNLYNKESEHYKILLEIIQRFSEEALESESIPVIVLFPSLEVLAQYRGDGSFAYSPLVDDLKKQSIRYVDVLEGFTKYGGNLNVPELIPGHYSVTGNKMVARYINEELQGLIESSLTRKQNR
jgi:hypothetical protein